jgi:urease accessory protein
VHDLSPHWPASLALHYTRPPGRTRTLVAPRHSGPLRVQKPLYPEGDGVCHSIIVHPPGGIAAGDQLTIDVRVGTGAHALLTTPGAARWYKAGEPGAHGASQRVALCIDDGGALEWLPQETLVYDRARVDARIDIAVSGSAAVLGWDVVALGRRAAEESFTQGVFAQTIALCVDGVPVWLEPTRLAGGDPLLASPVGLAGRSVFGCLWAYGPCWAGAAPDATIEAAVEALRAELQRAPPAQARAAATCVAPRLLLVRVSADGTAAAAALLQRAWHLLRPHVFGGRAAQPLRLWAT